MKLDAQLSSVLDASALMALINNEPGSALVQVHLAKACMSTINFTEVLSKMVEQGAPAIDAKRVLDNFNIELIAFDQSQIFGVSQLRLNTKQYGLSLGDRVCLNLGKTLGLPILTSDQIWAKMNDPDIKILLVR